jgi:hypothetical protein
MPQIWEKTEREAIACDLLRFVVWRDEGMTVVQTARQMGITSGLALRYERAIAALMDDLNNETAPDATEAVPDPPKEIHP